MQDTDRTGEIMEIPRATWDRLPATDTYTLENDAAAAKPLGWNRRTRRHPPQTQVKVVPHDVYLATKQKIEKARARRKAAAASRRQHRG